MERPWRDCAAWKEFGLPLTTSSNEAAKLYDAAVTQLLSYRELDSVGGLVNTITSMRQADPNFVMGRIFDTGLSVLSGDRSLEKDPTLQVALEEMKNTCSGKHADQRDKDYVEAIMQWADLDFRKACDTLEGILLAQPRDALAVMLLHLCYIYSGEKKRYRGIGSLVMPHWDKAWPHYGFLKGIQGFGLVENNYFKQAKECCDEALSIYPGDCWTNHTVAHVYEMQGHSKQGILVMAETEKFWKGSPSIDHHNYWHWALMHIDQGNMDEGLHIYDTQIEAPALRDQTDFSIVDATSMLKRLQLQGVNVGDRWENLKELLRPRLDRHFNVFNDVHVLLGCLGLRDQSMTHKLLESTQEYLSSGHGHYHSQLRAYGSDVLHACAALGSGAHAQAVELLYPVRYEAHGMGGSAAQTDIVNLLLLDAALQSLEHKHQQIARCLLDERAMILGETPMIQRLSKRLVSNH